MVNIGATQVRGVRSFAGGSKRFYDADERRWRRPRLCRRDAGLALLRWRAARGEDALEYEGIWSSAIDPKPKPHLRGGWQLRTF
jgi:hypothetical protein